MNGLFKKFDFLADRADFAVDLYVTVGVTVVASPAFAARGRVSAGLPLAGAAGRGRATAVVVPVGHGVTGLQRWLLLILILYLLFSGCSWVSGGGLAG